MQGIKLVTFDATNTLLKFRIPPWQYYGLVARDYGFTGSDDGLKYRMMESFKFMNEQHPNFGQSDVTWRNWWLQVVELTFKDQLPPSVDINKIAMKLIDEFRTTKCWTVAYGSPKLLKLLKKKGITLGVISNFDPRLNDILRNVNLRDLFDFVLTSYEVGFSKPDARIFERALKYCKTPTEPSQSIHIGDDLEKDYKAAREAGWHALLVTPKVKPDKPSAKDHVFTSIESLYETVQQNAVKL